MIASLAYAALPLLAAAQYGYEAPSAPAASSAAAPVASAPAASSAPGTPTIHRVVVGQSPLPLRSPVESEVEYQFTRSDDWTNIDATTLQVDPRSSTLPTSSMLPSEIE